MPDQNSVIGIYDSMAKAEAAVHTLRQRGFPTGQISLVAKDLESEKEVHGYVTDGDVVKSSAAAGAWAGGLFGFLIGAAFVWVPGFGPLFVAGPLAAALVGGMEGAAVGAAGMGLLGGLLAWGVSQEQITEYEEAVKAGKYLVIAHGTAAETEKAHQILEETDQEVLDVHSEKISA